MARDMISRQNIDLDLVPGGVLPVLHASQYDSAYDVHFTIYKDGQPFNIPSDVGIRLEETKLDGNGFTVGATKSPNYTGQCYIWMQEQMTAIPGDQICELVLTNTGGDRIGTINFILRVEPAALKDGTVISDSQIAYAAQVVNELGSVAAYGELLDAKIQKYDTVAQMKADTALKAGMYARTGGYYAVNDGGGALYRIDSSTPASYYETLTGGLFARLIVVEAVTVEQFGAYGDGTHDDTSAIAKALNCGAKVNFKQKVYCVSGKMEGTAEILCGNGAVIKVTAVSTNSVFVLTNVKKVSGFEFDCNNIGSNGLISVTNPDNCVEVSDIYIHDFNDTSSSYASTLINVQHIKSAHVHDIRFKNCKKLGNGVVTDIGAFKGVSVTDYTEDSEIDTVSSYNFNIVNASGTPIVDDADTIYVATASETACVLIHDLYGYNPGRRLIKSQCKHIIVDSVYCYTNATDSVALIGIQTYLGNDNTEKPPIGTVSNCIMINDNTYNNTARYLIAASGAVSINNCKLISPNHYAINNNGEMVLSDCTIEGYGVMDAGKTLKINNCVFSGHSFIYEPTNNEIEKITISNCDVDYTGAGQINYPFFDHNHGEVEISNSRYNGAVHFKTTGNNIMRDCICHCATIDTAYVLSGGHATIKNCKYYFTSSPTAISRPIRVDSGCTADIDNIEAVDFAYHAITNGTIRSKNTDPWKIWVNGGTLESYPVYVNALPTISSTDSSRIPNGIKVILITDGKMYSKSGATWTAVN